VTRWVATDLPAAEAPRAEEERRPRGPRRDGRPGGDRAGAGRARRPSVNAAPADGSDKPAGAGGTDANTAVKRVRKDAPATAADGKGE